MLQSMGNDVYSDSNNKNNYQLFRLYKPGFSYLLDEMSS